MKSNQKAIGDTKKRGQTKIKFQTVPPPFSFTYQNSLCFEFITVQKDIGTTLQFNFILVNKGNSVVYVAT